MRRRGVFGMLAAAAAAALGKRPAAARGNGVDVARSPPFTGALQLDLVELREDEVQSFRELWLAEVQRMQGGLSGPRADRLQREPESVGQPAAARPDRPPPAGWDTLENVR